LDLNLEKNIMRTKLAAMLMGLVMIFASGCTSCPIASPTADILQENAEVVVQENLDFIEASDMPEFAKEAKRTRNNEFLALVTEIVDAIKEGNQTTAESIVEGDE
jgi:thiol-disulfide isomerase/thioredoxin